MFGSKELNNNNVIFIDIDDTLCDTRGAFAECIQNNWRTS